MARVRSITAEELPADLAAIYEEFAGSYGPFRNQVAVLSHVPAALRPPDAAADGAAPGEDPAQALSRARDRHRVPAQRVPLLRGPPQALPRRRGDLRRGGGPDPSIMPSIPNSTPSTSSSSSMRSPPGSGRIASPRRSSPGCGASSARHRSWKLTLRITLCGFFNKFNDALGIEEEDEATARVAALAG